MSNHPESGHPDSIDQRDRDRLVPATRPSVTFEQARDELSDVVRRLEVGGTTLEESLTLWERGEELAGIAQLWLDGARTRLDAVRKEPGTAEQQ